jgi:hypothetical protein
MTNIEDLSLDEIVRFCQQKFNVRINIDSQPNYQGTSTEFNRNAPQVVKNAPPAPPMPTVAPVKPQQPTNDFRQQPVQRQAPPTQPYNPKQTTWNQQPQQQPMQRPAPAPQQQPAPRNTNFAPPPPQNRIIPPSQPMQQQQPMGGQTGNLPPVSFYNKTGSNIPVQQPIQPPQREAPMISPRQSFGNTQTTPSKPPQAPQTQITPPKEAPTNTQRKGSVLDRWSGFQEKEKISPGVEEARRLTANVSVKERREEIERLLKQVESQFAENDFERLAKEQQESQKQSMMKSITSSGAQGGQSGGINGGRGGMGGQGGQGYGQQGRQSEEEEPSMVTIPDTLLYSLQINTILQLLAMRQWKQAKQNLRNLQPYVQQGTKEDIFVRIVWSVYFNNYGVDLANQNNFFKAGKKAWKGQQLAEQIGLQSFRYIEHEYSYWAVLLNTNAILAQAAHRELRHGDCARIHANAYNALMGVQRNTNPNSISTINKTKMYAVNAIIFGIHAQDRNLLSTGVELLYPMLQFDQNLRPLLGHGYKNIGILDLKVGNNDSAKRWYDAAMSLV